MAGFEDDLWEQLVEEHGADGVTLTAPRGGVRPLMIGGGVTAVAAVAAAGVLGIGALTAAQPAYAMTENADGSYTVTINEIANAIPQLNAKFAQLGIDVTVVPVTADCSNPIRLDLGPATMDETVTLGPGHRHLDPGFTGVLAAEQLANGQVAMFMGAVPPPVPACFSATTAMGVEPGTGDGNGIPTITQTTVTPAPPTTGSLTSSVAAGASTAPTATSDTSAAPAATSAG